MGPRRRLRGRRDPLRSVPDRRHAVSARRGLLLRPVEARPCAALRVRRNARLERVDVGGAAPRARAPHRRVRAPTALAVVSIFLILAVFFLSLRRLGLSPQACAAGTLVLLFSGVFQSLPVYATTCAAVLPLAFALAEAPRLASSDAASRGRARAFAALAFGLSALGGE